MNFETLHATQATLDEFMSQRLFKEFLTTYEWRCYSGVVKENESSVDYDIDRFLKVHAKIPSLININSDKPTLVRADFPLEVFRWSYDAALTEGLLFANGSVTNIQTPKQILHLLFIADLDAKAFGYPKTGYYFNGSLH